MYPDLRPTDLSTFSAQIIELMCVAIIYVGLAKLSLALASIHRLQSAPRAESDPKLIRLLGDLAPDVGRTATESA
jgi:hypothetical protein